MLRTDLISLINSGKMWAFVGSGASVEAGCPSWGKLINDTLQRLRNISGKDKIDEISSDDRFKRAYSSERYELCFSRIEAHIGRDKMDAAVTDVLNVYHQPGKIIKLIANWPLAGYITTNYDSLLETGLKESGQKGWLSVGNSHDEIRKLSGEPEKIVWHIHGMINASTESFYKVLTDKDYDKYYLETSPMAKQLQGLLAQRRVIFIGFGFKDVEVMRLLKLVGSYCNPVRPAFAYLGDLTGDANEGIRLDLLEKNNIDVIPYRIIGNSHVQLTNNLEIYNSLILRRNLKFGEPERPCPSYDEETTGLYLYNNLVLRNQADLHETAVDYLMQSRILAILKLRGSIPIKLLKTDLLDRIKLLQTHGQANDISSVDKCLNVLSGDNLVTITKPQSDESLVALSEKGTEHIQHHEGAAKLLSQHFTKYIYDRATEIIPDDMASAARVAKAAETFLKDSVKKRSLGVAMAWYAHREDYQKYHITALLQNIAEYYSQLNDQKEGLALISLIEGILSEPSSEEKKYLSIALQAQFGVNLLGFDPTTLKERAKELSGTLFLLDSSTLIPLLAKNCIGNRQADILVNSVKTLGGHIATTYLLATEVAEHARWAIEHLSDGLTINKIKTLIIAMGRTGYKSNAFIEGFLDEVSSGSTPDFKQYLSTICGQACDIFTDEIAKKSINDKGIECFELNEWVGFHDPMWAERDDLQKKIKDLRLGHNPPTYRHERQVKAEAEALVIVRDLRKGILKYKDKIIRNSYFLSRSRVIDHVAGGGLPITMRPEGALQWINTLTACPVGELDYLFDNLLWELSERGFSIVNRNQLQYIFGPLIDASKKKYQEEIETHRALLTKRYGVDPRAAFKDVNDLDSPIVLESYYAQKTKELEKKLAASDKAVETLQTKAKITEKERQQLEVLKSIEMDRKNKGKSQKRAAASRAGLKRKRKSKKKNK